MRVYWNHSFGDIQSATAVGTIPIVSLTEVDPLIKRPVFHPMLNPPVRSLRLERTTVIVYLAFLRTFGYSGGPAIPDEKGT